MTQEAALIRNQALPISSCSRPQFRAVSLPHNEPCCKPATIISCTAGGGGGGDGGRFGLSGLFLGDTAVNSLAWGTLDYTLSSKTHLLQQDPAWCTIDGPHPTISHSQE